MSDMFYGCSSLVEVPLLDTSKVTEMNYMFTGCSVLKEVPLLDTSKVTEMNYMFARCKSLVEVPELDTSKVTNTDYMFSGCLRLKTIPFADKIKDLKATKLPFLEELKTLPDEIKVKLLMDTSNFKDKKIQAMIKLYKD
jgi:surface protein